MAAIAECGHVQFVDLNSRVNAFQRTFVSEVRRLLEMQRRVRFLCVAADRGSVELAETTPLLAGNKAAVDALDAATAAAEDRVKQMLASTEALGRTLKTLTELRHVLRETAVFFNDSDSDSHSTLGFVAGVVPRDKAAVFERVLFRALRGNLLLNTAEISEPIEDPNSQESVRKNAFIVFAHGAELIAKIKKICESLGATIYPVDENSAKRRENALEIIARIEDLRHVLDNTKASLHVELRAIALNLNDWKCTVEKEMAVHHTMNLFNYDVNRKALIAEGWCPSSCIENVRVALRSVTVLPIF